MSSERDIQKTLETTARHVARKHGYEFTAPCWDRLEVFIRQGVKRMTTEGVADDPRRISLAEKNMARLVTQMVLEAHEQNLSELHELTLKAARKTLCPLWPFCT